MTSTCVLPIPGRYCDNMPYVGHIDPIILLHTKSSRHYGRA